VSIDRSFLDEVFGDAEGYAHFAVGHRAYVDRFDQVPVSGLKPLLLGRFQIPSATKEEA